MIHKTFAVIFTAFFLLIGPDFLFAVQSPSLNALIEECLKNNPQIQAAKYRYEAAKARVNLFRSLDDPKFEFEYDKITADMDAAMNGKTGSMRTFSLSQEFPFPTKLILRKQAAQKESASYEQEYKETEQKVIKDLKEAYSRLFLSRKKIKATKDNLENLKQFVEISTAKYSVNKTGQQDPLKAQVEYSKLSNQLVLLEQDEKIAESMFNSLLNRQKTSEIVLSEEGNDSDFEITEEKALEMTRKSRPELKSFREMVRKSQIDYSLSKQEYLPDFMVKYKREEKNGGLGSWAGSIGVNVPLWFWEKQNSMVKEAQANVKVVEAEYKATENMVLFETRSAFAKFEAAKSLVKIYETGVLPQVQSAFETARLGYQADKIGFLDLLDSLRSLREFQMEYFESLAGLEIARADLERSIGADIGK